MYSIARIQRGEQPRLLVESPTDAIRVGASRRLSFMSIPARGVFTYDISGTTEAQEKLVMQNGEDRSDR
jgi:hypothetical protein